MRFCILLLSLMVVWPCSLLAQEGQTKEEPNISAEDPAETLGKLTLTLDTGGHTHDIKNLVFTPDGKHIISGSGDRSIRIWDVVTGQSIRTIYQPGARGVPVFALSPDGQKLAVNTIQKLPDMTPHQSICILSPVDGRIQKTLPINVNRILRMAFSADSKRLAFSTFDNSIHIWNIETGKAEPELTAPGQVVSLAFSRDGNQLALFTKDFKCGIRDLKSEKYIPLQAGKPSINWGGTDKIAWSPDGKTIATCGDDGIRLFDPTGKMMKHLLPKIWVHNVSISSDSRQVIGTTSPNDPNGARAVVFNMQTGKQGPSHLLKDHFPWTSTISPNGDMGATGTGGDNPKVILWNTSKGNRFKAMGAKSWLHESTAKAGWSGKGGTVLWQDVKDPEKWKGGPTSFNLNQLEFGPPRTGKVIGPILQQGPISVKVVKEDNIQILKNGKLLSTLKLPKEIQHARNITLISQDRVALCGNTYAFYLFDTQTGNNLGRLQHPGWVLSLAPSPDGQFILSLAEDQTLRIWNAKEKSLLMTLYVSGQEWIAWTPLGYYAATPGGERLMGWTVNHGVDKETDFYPAERFRKQLYRPDVIQLLFGKGNVEEALKAADAALGNKTRTVNLEHLIPPQTTITLDPSKKPVVTVNAKSVAASKTQLVKSMRLFIDGRPALIKDAEVLFEQGKQEATASWTFEIPEGLHKISVRGSGPDVGFFSDVISVEGKTASKLPTMYVLGIGVDKYKESSLNLQAAVNDVNALLDSFKKNCKGDLFGDVSADRLLDEAVQPLAILDKIKAVRSKARESDLFVLFFACHGVKEKDQFYLLTHEANVFKLKDTALSGDKLIKELADFPCQTMLIMDACHSAGFGEGRTLSKAGLRPSTDDATRSLTADDIGVVVFSAAMGHQKAIEEKGHGLLTAGLLEALEAGPDVPKNRSNQRIFLHHLKSYVVDYVMDKSHERQTPFMNLPWSVETFAIRGKR